MTQDFLLPSKRLRAFAALARWSLWLLAAMWLSLGLLWGALHFLIVPRIGELRPWVEQQATQALGITVRISAISAHSSGLIPSVQLSDVRLFDAQGREALRLPVVLAALSPRSAWGLRFEQLYIEGAQLDIRRTPDGQLWVAGFALATTPGTNSPTLDWIFSQPELALRHGTLRWTDELRGAPLLQLDGVDVVLRSRLRSHALRLDFTPPAAWGSRLSVMGQFRQPLLTRHNGDWSQWSGQLYAHASELDLALLHAYADLGVELTQGRGALRAWVGVEEGQLQTATADVALQAVQVRAAPELEPVELQQVFGRLGASRLPGGLEYAAESLRFDTRDGLHWPGGNVRLRLLDANAQGELEADRLDLAALAQLVNRLPVEDALRQQLLALAPRGLVEQVKARWQGSLQAPQHYALSARVQGLALASQPVAAASVTAPAVAPVPVPTPAASATDAIGIPGVQGLNLEFSLDEKGGRAQLQMQGGTLDFPGVFAQSAIALDQLRGELQWTLGADKLTLEIERLQFANADAQGEAQGRWSRARAATTTPASTPTPTSTTDTDLGQLDLQGSLSRAQLSAVPRYLPLAMDPALRLYLQQALLGGSATGVKFAVRGALAQFPFTSAAQGDLRIAADLQNASYAFAPASVLDKDSLPWPALSQVTGSFLLERNRLQIKPAKGQFAPYPALGFSNAEVQISDLFGAPVVAITGDVRGPLADALALVQQSPLGTFTDQVLDQASASGVADYKLKLNLPLDALQKSTVQGSVVLAGNDFQFSADTPRLQRLRGSVGFSDTGMSLAGVQGRALGGDVRMEGGLSFVAASGAAARTPAPTIRLQGVATAEGLRQARELGLVARLAEFASGAAAYTMTLGLRAGQPDVLVASSLSGMALRLPPPFDKAADTPLPLRFEMGALRTARTGAPRQDALQLDLGRLATVRYERDLSGKEARVLRGSIGVGLAEDEVAPMPADGVAANIQLDTVDVDAWTQLAAKITPPTPAPAGPSPQAGDASQAYWPTTLAMRARTLTVGGRKVNGLLVGGSREGLLWRANVEASELNGYVEYRQSGGAAPGRLYARLARLVFEQSAAQDVENLLDQQPASIPALDVVVEDFELRGKKMGRVEVQAVNMAPASGSAAASANARDASREWRLNRFNISTPEATLAASGNWVAVNAQSAQGTQGTAAAGRNVRERRRTVLNFKLDITDSGNLLKRYGMDGVIAKGRGKLEGQVSWLGSPITPDFAGMGGGFNVNVESGQFLKADPGIAKLLGVLSLQSLPRRLALDFRDVFSEGFAFDFVRGDVTIEQGIARTNNLQMKGVNAAVLMEGQADIAKETQNIKVVVIPEINAGSASLIASTINPLVGLTTFLAQLILRRPLIEATTQEFLIDGTWLEPRVTPVERK